MKRLPSIVLLLLTCAPALVAELNFTFPRTRTFADVGHTEGGGRGRSESRGMAPEDAFDLMPFRAGASLGYASTYQWRDFAMSGDGLNWTFDGFASMYGFEASIFALADSSDDYDYSAPVVTDYRLSYSHKIYYSLNTIAYTLSDWSNSAADLGGKVNGFNPPLPGGFEEETQTLYLSSIWFNDLVQPDGANYFLGAETWIRTDDSGFRVQPMIGVFTNDRGGTDILRPNAARVTATVIYQSEYFTDESGFIGSDFNLEMVWDMRREDIPLFFVLGGEYYWPWNNDEFQDRFVVTARVELAF
ncbi:MAG: hypothetical protein L6Q71_01900 [Planctomycetes bacterium]|nr:hypothetical protein [Planctomycetota bacterium]NUQ35847.1 hypothetical protein [Planctomycetaceae bacterium]